MSVIPGADGWPGGWEHRIGANVRRFERGWGMIRIGRFLNQHEPISIQ
jgi:hypothetical protein